MKEGGHLVVATEVEYSAEARAVEMLVEKKEVAALEALMVEEVMVVEMAEEALVVKMVVEAKEVVRAVVALAAVLMEVTTGVENSTDNRMKYNENTQALRNIHNSYQENPNM